MLSATVRKFRTVSKEGNRMITRNHGLLRHNPDGHLPRSNPLKSRIKNNIPHSSGDKRRAILQ